LKAEIFYSTLKTLSPTTTLAFYVAVNSKVVGLAPDFTVVGLAVGDGGAVRIPDALGAVVDAAVVPDRVLEVSLDVACSKKQGPML
jgi:hypothetical protein